MDPNIHPSDPSDDQHVHLPRRSRRRFWFGHDNNNNNDNSPPISAPGSPHPVEDNASDYFNSLSHAPSAQSTMARTPSGTIPFPSLNERRPAADSRLPSIRLRRTSNASLASLGRSSNQSTDSISGAFAGFDSGRPRSISQPERAHVPENAGLARHSRRIPQQIAMPRLTEEGGRPSLADLGIDGDDTVPMSPTRSMPDQSPYHDPNDQKRFQHARNMTRKFWPRKHHDQNDEPPMTAEEEEYNRELVDFLDVIDPEISTLSTLTNVQNSLFIPDLGHWVNRRPTYVLSKNDPQAEWASNAMAEERRREAAQHETPGLEIPPPLERTSTITSRLTESHYAALPHGTTLEGWTAEEKSELDDHVRHMMHSRRARFKRRMKGFGQYVRRPLGFLVTLYATLITLFGLAWVLFLIGWIYVGDKQLYVVHIIDSVLVALFAIMGDGLAPFRAVDTYHLFFINRYMRMIQRAEAGKKPRAKLQKKSVPEEIRTSVDFENAGRLTSQQARRVLEAGAYRPTPGETLGTVPEDHEPEDKSDLENGEPVQEDMPALTWKQLKSLQHHQKKMAKSHSFYKPQETFTHHAFPLGYLIGVVLLLDFHSCLQISLGATTWGIDYKTRPMAITTVILCVSITANCTAGLLITLGDRKTRKKAVTELLNRRELTEDAIKEIQKKKEKEQEQEGKSDKDDDSSDKDNSGRSSREGRTSREGRLSRDGNSSKEVKKLTKMPT